LRYLIIYQFGYGSIYHFLEQKYILLFKVKFIPLLLEGGILHFLVGIYYFFSRYIIHFLVGILHFLARYIVRCLIIIPVWTWEYIPPFRMKVYTTFLSRYILLLSRYILLF
jgi:hypothetical protein